MSENTESKKVRTSSLIPQIKEIVTVTENLEKIVEQLPAGSVKEAYTYSLKNLQTKNDKFLSVKTALTDEQKEAVNLVKRGKFLEAQKILAALSPAKDTSVDEKPTETKTAKKKR